VRDARKPTHLLGWQEAGRQNGIVAGFATNLDLQTARILIAASETRVLCQKVSIQDGSHERYPETISITRIDAGRAFARPSLTVVTPAISPHRAPIACFQGGRHDSHPARSERRTERRTNRTAAGAPPGMRR